MSRRHVLVTGASGYIASQLLPALRERYTLTLLDVKETNPRGERVPEVKIANLADADYEKYGHHFWGVDTVVHLGYYRPAQQGRGGWQRRGYHEERVNVDMAYNVYRLAHDHGVRRVVVASSNHAADWYEHLIHQGLMDMVYPQTFPLSDNFYGWAKAAYEHIGFIFATGYFGRPLENIQIRIGAPREIRVEDFPDTPEGRQRYRRDLGAYISERDLQQLFLKSIETPQITNEHGIPFQIFYGISDNTRKFWSIVNARKVIGYAPEDDSEVKYARDIAQFLLSSS
ncbi:MAG: NAD(P)-dependent oxidoreductase [Nitrospinota bacterium]|nr:MAG: NAD(P)-dependent oxidoreductase [Nitrospinota bacterium]